MPDLANEKMQRLLDQIVDFMKSAHAEGYRRGVEDAAAVVEKYYETTETPHYPFDNGGTADGWKMACREILEVVRALTAASDKETDSA